MEIPESLCHKLLPTRELTESNHNPFTCKSTLRFQYDAVTELEAGRRLREFHCCKNEEIVESCHNVLPEKHKQNESMNVFEGAMAAFNGAKTTLTTKRFQSNRCKFVVESD